jgi:hypothetical protein
MEYSGLVQGNSENEMGRQYVASGVLLRVYACAGSCCPPLSISFFMILVACPAMQPGWQC